MQHIILAALILFSIVCALFQIKSPFTNLLDKIDKIGILPNWSFFAPIPGTTDYRILYRDYNLSNTISDWKEIDMFFKIYRKHDFFWNPNKFYQKGIIDLIQALLIEHSKTQKKEFTQLSWPYLVILKIVMNESSDKDVNRRQFLIINSSGFDENRNIAITFISKVHTVSNGYSI